MVLEFSFTFCFRYGLTNKNFNNWNSKMKQGDIFDTLWKIITIILLVLIFYWIVQLFFVGSPTLSQFNFALIIMTMGLLIKIYRDRKSVV